jgi:tetratricopeptide (TPR) repeat protein
VNGQAPTSRPAPLWAPALLVLGALVAYANSFSVPFVFDDIPAIVDNPTIRQFWGATDATPSAHAGGLTLSGRPVVAFSLALNHALSGNAVWSYHVFNLLIHILSGLTLFGLLRRTLERWSALTPTRLLARGREKRVGINALHLALAIACLWTVHPLQTESVTYIVQRAESLMGLFYLLTLYAFVRATDCHLLIDNLPPGPAGKSDVCQLTDDKRVGHDRAAWLAFSVAACALGMATKEVMVTAPVLVLLYDRTFVAGSFAGAWRMRRNFYLGLAATWLLLAYFVISTGGNRGGTVGFGVGVTPWAYAFTQFHAIARYLALSFWPHPLVFDYGTFWVTRPGDVLPYAAVVLPLVGATLWALWRWPALGFAGAWFFGILAPTSLTPGTIQMIVEHRMYLPLAALLALAVIALHRWAGRVAPALCVLAGIACVALTVQRNATYRSELTLWSEAVAERPANSIAQNNLGRALFKAGRLDDAVTHYESAVQANPANLEARFNLALACARLGHFPAAFEQYMEVLRVRPDFAEAHSNYGSALLKAGRREEAAAQFRAALTLKPDLAEAHSNLGDMLLQSGRVTEAAAELETALRLKPELAEAHYNLGNVLAQQDQMPRAVAHYEQALRLQPDYADAHINAGNALLQLDRVPEAVAHYEAALRLNPSSADAHNNLGTVFLHSGRLREAITHFEQALAARPDFADAQRNLAEARAQLRAQPGAK